jgi:hypothetical protein
MKMKITITISIEKRGSRVRSQLAKAFFHLRLLSPGSRRLAAHARPREQGMMLIDCLAYIALLALILGLTFSAFYRTTENSRNLAGNAGDIVRALNAGERWREDLRASSGPPRSEEENGAPILRLPQAGGDVSYAFRDGAVFRRALPNTNWTALLPAVAFSTMHAEPRSQVICWHWDIELKGRQKVARVRPVFSFVAVNQASLKR